MRARHESLQEREHYRHIRIRVVEPGVPGLDYPSKLDRSSGLIQALLANGAERAEWFFDERSRWPREGAIPAVSTDAADQRPDTTRQRVRPGAVAQAR